jgi:hypothetical protein
MLYIDNSANTLQSDRLLLQLAPTKFEMDLHDIVGRDDSVKFKKQDLMIQRLKMLIKAGADIKQQPDSNGVHQDKFQAGLCYIIMQSQTVYHSISLLR